MSENKKNPIDYNAAIDVRARGQSSYRIFPSDSFDDLSRCMEELGSKDLRVCVVTDSNVEKLYLDDVKNVLEGSCARLTSFTIPAGEQHKTLDEIRRLYTHLIGPLLALLSFCLLERRKMSFGSAMMGLLPMLLYGAVYLYKVMFAPEDRRWEDFYGFNKAGKWPIACVGMVAGASLICVLFWRVCGM